MPLQFKCCLMDEAQLNRCMVRITHEIIEKNHGAEGLCLIGIRRRGVPLAEQLRDNILRFEGVDVPCGYVDISLYRDDLTEKCPIPSSDGCFIPCNLKDRTVILVDDVIFTGRTTRAAIDAIFGYGRPKAIRLAVLVDRGHRELPFHPDFVGKNIPTARTEIVRVKVASIDGETGIDLYTMENSEKE